MKRKTSNWNQTWPTNVAKKPVHYEDFKILNYFTKFCWYAVYIAERKISFNSCQVSLSCSVLDICEANHIWKIVSKGEPSWADDTRKEVYLSRYGAKVIPQKLQRVNRYCVSPLILWDNKQKKKCWSSVQCKRIYPIFCYHTYNQVSLYDFLYSVSPLWSFSMT